MGQNLVLWVFLIVLIARTERNKNITTAFTSFLTEKELSKFIHSVQSYEVTNIKKNTDEIGGKSRTLK